MTRLLRTILFACCLVPEGGCQAGPGTTSAGAPATEGGTRADGSESGSAAGAAGAGARGESAEAATETEPSGNIDAAPTGMDTGGADATDATTTVVIFFIDGVMYDAVQTAVARGAPNLKLVLDDGVRAEAVHCTSPAVLEQLPDGSLPWGKATSGNTAVHTGTHLFEAPSTGMDDIFLAARAAGIRSVFSGGDANYAAFTTADFHYAGALTDDVVVQHAVDHLKNDQVRLVRVHLQRIRDDWTGPAGKTNPNSAYVTHLVQDDALLGNLIQTLKDIGVWDRTYLVVGSDHGMGQTSASAHPPSTSSSWDPFLAFHGPGLKRGTTIPYAELPDVAVTAMRFLGLPPLRGHTDPKVALAQKGATGTFLANLFEGAPADIDHPRYIARYLDIGTYTQSDLYAPYRDAMLGLIK